MEREPIGIAQVDEMIEGGLPKDSIIGLEGPPGVGKSILALHVLLEGARRGHKSLYICLDEPLSNVEQMIGEFSFAAEFRDYVKRGLIVIRCYSYLEYEKAYEDLFSKINEERSVRRLVIDTFNVFFSSAYTPAQAKETSVRKKIYQTFGKLRREGLLSVLLLESVKSSVQELSYNIPYMVDGMISLDFLDLGTIERRLFIPKMRWTDQYKESKSFEITEKGINIIEDTVS